MKHSNRLAAISAGLLCALWLTACGEDQELTEYYDNMNTFFDHVAAINDEMNNIDRDAEDAQGELLSYLDELQTEITWMAGLMREILDRIETIGEVSKSRLYQHMTFKAVDPDFTAGLRQKLSESLGDETFDYMKGNEDWEKLSHKNANAMRIANR